MSSSSSAVSSGSSDIDDIDQEMTEVSSILIKKTGVSIGKLLGEGTFGKVFSASRKSDGKEFALKKVITSTVEHEMSAKFEIEVLTLLKEKKLTEHLSYLYFCFSNGGSVYMMLDKMDIDLLEFMINRNEQKNYITLEEVVGIGKQILTGLGHLHSLNIVHTDLQPSNVMIVNRNILPYKVKIIDFGCALPKDRLLKAHGAVLQSQGYNSPESILGSRMTEKIDIFSVGVILSELYAGIPMFPATSDYQMLKFIIGVCGIPQVTEDYLHWNRYLTKKEITVNDLTVTEYQLKPEDEMTAEELGDTEVEIVYPYKGFARMILLGANNKWDLSLAQDIHFADWVGTLLSVHPELRPSAQEALESKIFREEKRPQISSSGPIRSDKSLKSIKSTEIYKKQIN